MKKTAFLFPGQGSQYIGMLADFAKHPEVKQTFDEAQDVLSLDIWQLCQQGTEEELNKTSNTQPALLTASVALWRLWRAKGGMAPDFMAGHSLGEYSALVCADSLPFDKALTLVRQRGQYMQSAVSDKKGAMAAIIGFSLDEVQRLCDATARFGYVQPANINTDIQIVIAGYANAVEMVCKRAKKAGAKRTVMLTVSVPSHCELMRPAAELLAEEIRGLDINEPSFQLLQNIDAQVVQTAQDIKENLIRQLVSPVLWSQIVRALSSAGVSLVAECGPGRVLSGLNRAIDKEIQSIPLGETSERFIESLETFQTHSA